MPTSVPSIPLRRAAPSTPPAQERGGPAAGFMRDGRAPVFRGWHPPLRDASDDVRAAWWGATSRAQDLIHNSGWLTGAIDQAVANTVGLGLRLASVPDAEALGWTPEQANAFARLVERRFELWGRNPLECDIEARRTFGQMQAAAFKGWFATGEILAEMAWKRRPGATSGTKVRLIPPHRLAQRTEGPRLVQGVRMDVDWAPVSYIFRRKTEIGDVEIEVPARDETGRPRIVHVFDGVAGTYRGITPLVSALQVTKRFDQLADAALTASLVRAVFAATIKSSDPTEDILKGLLTPQEQARMASENLSAFDCWAAMQDGWYRGAQIDLGVNGRFAQMFPGQELEFHHAQGSASDYRDQALFLMRELMRCLGLTYESGTLDYTNATYSSVRMATGEIFLVTTARRKNIVAPFCQAAFECWLEEEIDAGRIAFPGGIEAFVLNRAAACRAEWRGTAKPQADDLKLAKAHETWANLGVMSDEMMAADLGVDIEDVYEQRARERDLRAMHKLPERNAGAKDPVADKLLAGKDE